MRRRDEKGGAMVEAPVAIIVMLILAFGIVTLTQVVYVHLNLASGVRAAARYAAKVDYDPAANPTTAARRRSEQQVKEYAVDAASPADLDPNDVTCTTTENCVTVVARDGEEGPAVPLEDTVHGDVVTVRAETVVRNGIYGLAADALNGVGGMIGLGTVLDPDGIAIHAEAETPVE